MATLPLSRLVGISLLAAVHLANAAFAQGGSDPQTQALVWRLQGGDRRGYCCKD